MSAHLIFYKDGAKMMRPVTTREEYINLRNSQQQQALMKAVREGDSEQKRRLVQMNYSCMPNADGTLKGTTTPSNTVGMDIDHIPADEMQVVKERILAKKDELGLLMLEESARGEGCHLVFRRHADMTQEDNLRWASNLLGVAYDAGAKDITRVFFTTTEKELVFLDDELFKNEAGQQPSETPHCETNHADVPADTPPKEGSKAGSFKGIPYSTIIEEYWRRTGGEPKEGERNVRLYQLASNLRCICDNKREVLMTVMPRLGLSEQEIGSIIDSACKEQPKAITKMMREILRQADSVSKQKGSQKEDSHGEEAEGEAIPLEKFADELKRLSRYYPCMKELFMNVHPQKMPAVFFSSAALFGTLMTRAWYHFWYEPELVRRLNYSIFIIGDPGAGKNVIEKFYKKIAEPMIEADRAMIDAVNRYKEGRTERTTSTKAQKGDALKKPLVGIRVHPARTANGEFIRHMLAAVEMVEGRQLNLHMFSFDSELDNVTKNNKGGDFKDREVMELKAFHNEEDGQMYGSQESITGMFNVYWNFIYTGTPYALHRKVNQRNFGTGMSTRLAVIPLPDMGLAKRRQQADPNASETLRVWAYRLDKVTGEIPIEPLNDETYEWQSQRLEVAEFNGDKADRTLLKRIPYYGIGISLPFIMMRHWDEWQEHRTLTMDKKDRQLCRLAMEIQYRCQQFYFGEMAHNYFEDQNKEFVTRRRTSRYDDCYRKLPAEFKTPQFMECFGASQSTASRAINRFIQDGIVERVSRTLYRKIMQELP